MGRDRGGNALILSSKRQWREPGGHGGDLEKLRSALEAEKSLNRQAQQRFSLELRRLRKEAEWEQQRALRELTAKHERQKAQELLRLQEALGRERAAEVRCLLRYKGQELRPVGAGLGRVRRLSKEASYAVGKCGGGSRRGTSDTEPGCVGSEASYRKLEQLLGRLQEQLEDGGGEEAVVLERLRQELDLEKGLYLCHMLEAHGRPGTGKERNQSSSRDPRPRSNSCVHRTSRTNSGNSPKEPQGGGPPALGRSLSLSLSSKSPSSPPPNKRTRREQGSSASGRDLGAAARCPSPLAGDTCRDGSSSQTTSTPSEGLDHQAQSLGSEDMEDSTANGTDYGFLVRQNSELLRALDEMEKTCTHLREENGLLRKSSTPETEEKVRRLRRKNTELAVIAKRLEDRARKLQEANLKVVNAPAPLRPGAVEQYKRAFARQRARDLAQHADTLLSKDKEIAALQQECWQLEARRGTAKDSLLPSGTLEFQRLLKESQKEVLRLQRQLSISSSRQVTSSKDTSCGEHNGHDEPSSPKEEGAEKVAAETPCVALDEAPARCEDTPREEELGPQVTPPPPGLCPTPTPCPSHQELHTEEQRIQLLERELSKKRKECENLEHEVRKRQKRCLDLESQLEDERSKNEQLEEEADLLRRKAQLLDQARVENEELREDLSEVTAQRDSVLEENQRLRAKLENLEQVLKHMREVAERRQQLELEHEQALAILKFKQDEIKRLQRAEFFAKREHEGVVQMLEDLIRLVLQRELSKVRELEDKCRSQSEQFGLLSRELETFRLQAGKLDLSSSALLTNPALCHLTNGVGLAGERDVAATLRMGATPHAAGLTRSPTTKHRELPSISLTKSSSTPRSAPDTTHLSPKSAESHPSPHHSPCRTSPTPHEVDTASEVEELDIDVSPAPYTALRGVAKLQVFIARYSYNPYDGPNDNPEVELPLTAGEYIYVYGGMDDDGFYEGELMDGRRGLVPSNFVERVSDDDMMSAHLPEGTDISHNSLLDSSLHSVSHRVRPGGPGTSERTDPTYAASAPGPVSVHPGEQIPAPSEPDLPALLSPAPLTNGLDLDLEVGLDTVPYPRKLTLIKQLAKSIIIGWDGPLVPAGWGNVWSYNVYVDQELRLNVPFGSQTKAVLERLDVNLKAYRVSVQSLTERGTSDQLRCSMLVGRDVCVAPTELRVDRVTATSASVAWLPSNSNYVHIVSLNEVEVELVKASSYSLSLSDLTPNQHYTVRVEARPHLTPWELPPERRDHKTATTTFTTLAAGPPDAPLDVQLEQGPSPGIALISWLPVTIDAAGSSNGVRVTGYTIYADSKKVLEVSSPTAGSALMGPSQIQSLMAAQELTVRTTSAHGESADSLPVNVPTKLAVVMTGQASASCSSTPPVHQPPPVHRSPPVHQSPPFLTSSPPIQPQPHSHGNSAAKVSMLPYAAAPPPADVAQAAAPSRGLPSANSPPVHALHTEASSPRPASYVDAWANPLAKSPDPTRTALAVHKATVSSPIAPAYQAKLAPVPSTYEAMMSPPIAPAYQTMLPLAAHINTVGATLPTNPNPGPGPAASEEISRADTGSPGVPRSVMSITDFLPVDDYSRAILSTPEPDPSPTKAPVDPTGDHQGTHLLRPPKAPSPLESEPDYSIERSTARLVSMDEFLKQEQDTGFDTQPKGYAGGLGETPYGAAEASRGSDLSDILEEEEDDLYSDPVGSALPRGYTTGANRSDQWDVPDSDEEVLERILKLPHEAEVYHHNHHRDYNKHLFSIPEVTDEEDNSLDRDYNQGRYPRQSQASPVRTHLHPNDPHYHRPRHQPQPAPHHHHHGVQAEATEPLPRHPGGFGAAAGARPRHTVRYSDGLSSSEEGCLHPGHGGDTGARRAHQKTRRGAGGSGLETVALVGGLGDRLRREALLRSQMAVAALTSQAPGHAPRPGSYMVSKTVRTVKSPVGSVMEIDLEYGTDEDEPSPYDAGERGEVVVEQMSSEWWVEGAQRRGKPALQAINAAATEWENGRDPLMEAAVGRSGQPDVSPKRTRTEVRRQLKESMEPAQPVGENDVRIFVALFPYDPVNMSPNPDAAEEELPFKEGQIIKVYGDKDPDGFYCGESNGRHGYVPCNMVSEIQVEDEETRETLLRQGFLSTAASMDRMGTRSHAQLPRRPVPPPKPRRSKKVEPVALWEDSLDCSSQDPSQSGVATAIVAGSAARRMKAIFDYDPRESSPNADIEAELTFSAGDIIYVFGDMDDDGFFYGDLNGHKGLVPSNFLQAAPEAAGKCPSSDPQPPPQPVSQPRRESQVSPSPQMDRPTPEEVPPTTLNTGQSGPVPTPTQRLDPSSADPGSIHPTPAPRQATPSTPPPHVQEDSPSRADQRGTSPPGKKKKGFFSKGKKLFKKLGSNKKD
ncbi:peripheral-type benzodiazepine receptor-associated protein 1 isoform X3 [Esox lucius]|uniref:peripheral-type benzodiazepine receptor-associated protein 1 isoform X3 n=1 Tax=Esox lucius TaxID=8010 RepID=UPI0014776FD5|nr:peripheral-type benzodiazepine receptor-associated protein 1 isoform X3 [Esox lucius]